MTMGVYAIQELKTRVMYVGSSKNIELRFASHVAALKAGRHCNPRLQDSWLQHGQTSFVLHVLEVVEIESELSTKEFDWIANVKANDGVLFNSSSQLVRGKFKPPSSNVDMKDVGNRVRDSRETLTLSQGDLAKRAGVAVITINRIENGHGDDPRPSTVRKIAKALEVDPRWLMFGEMSDG